VEKKSSGWDLYIGIAAEDKVHNSRILKVVTKEISPFMNGELKDLSSEEVFNIVDDETNVNLNEKITTTNVITAEYFGLDTNRVFPADVRKGEQVFIFRHRDSDIFFWIPIGRDDDLRRKEILRYAISNDNRTKKKLNDDNTYYVELDTLFKKRIRIRTSKSDGEKYRYEITIDAKKNLIVIKDDGKNEILLQSDVPRIRLKNRSNSFMDINKGDIFIMAPNDIYIKAGRQLITDASSTTQKSKTAHVIEAKNIGMKAAHVNVDSDTFGVTGDMKIMKVLKALLVVAGGYSTFNAIGAAYPPVTTNIDSGTGTEATPAPDNSGGDAIRRAAAWEQVHEALDIIKSCLAAIDNHEDISMPDYSSLSSLADTSIMELNKGK